MSETYKSVFYDESPIQEDKSVPFILVFLAPFVFGAVSVAALDIANYIVWAAGIICAIAYIISSIQNKLTLPKDLLLYWGFFAWSTWGVFNCKSSFLFWTSYTTVFQFCILIAIIVNYSKNLRTAKILLIAVFLGILLVILSSYWSGEFQRAERGAEEKQQVAGMAINANAFGQLVVYASAILLFFFKASKSLVMKVIIVFLLLAFTRFVVLSGSRKTFLTFLLLLFLWYIISYRKEIIKRPVAFIFGGIMVLGLGFITYKSVSGTLMEERMKTGSVAITGGMTHEGSIPQRFTFYREGLVLTASHPIFGIGLANFIVHSSGFKYSHSNYIEVFVSSGLPGGIMYYSVYLVLWLRLRRLSKIPFDDGTLALINMGKAFLLVQLVGDLGTVSYYIKGTWIILGILIGFTYSLEERYKMAQWQECPSGYNMNLAQT